MNQRVATILVNTCYDCPLFDNVYYSYNHRCTLLKIEISNKIYDIGVHPKCPLPRNTNEE